MLFGDGVDDGINFYDADVAEADDVDFLKIRC